MSVVNLPATSDEDFFSRTLSMLEAELEIDIPPVSASVFDSVLADFTLYSPTASSTGMVSSPSSSDSEPTSINRTLRVALKAKRYRNRKREELESLRSTVKTLEVRLASLKALPAPAEPSQVPVSRIWEALASQESERRQASERENEELRESVEMHRQLAQKLDQVIKKVIAHVNTRGSF